LRLATAFPVVFAVDPDADLGALFVADGGTVFAADFAAAADFGAAFLAGELFVGEVFFCVGGVVWGSAADEAARTAGNTIS
jgi:hypothetical protein